MVDDAPLKPPEQPQTGWMNIFPDNPVRKPPIQADFAPGVIGPPERSLHEDSSESKIIVQGSARGTAFSSGRATATLTISQSKETLDAFEAMQERIRDLEIAISRMPPPPAGLGHNNPPEPIEDVPVTLAEWEEVRWLLGVVKEQPVAPAQDPIKAKAAASRLKAVGEKILSFTGRRFEEFLSEFSKKLGASAGAAALVVFASYGHAWLNMFATGLIDVCSLVQAWVHSLGF